MSSRTGGRNRERSAPVLPIPRWAGSHALALVRELNELCLDMLVRLARAKTAGPLELVDELRDLWRALDPAARRRAAACPVLLYSIQFQDETWWRTASEAHSARLANHGGRARVAPRGAADLVRTTLLQARCMVRADRDTARLVFGMMPAVAAHVAALGLHDIQRIGHRHGGVLRPRWPDVPAFWRRLLVSARSADGAAMPDVYLHSLQLQGSELIDVG